MQKNNIIASLVLLTLVGSLCAQFPNHEMKRNTLGVKAQLSFRGQNITSSNDPSSETMPFLHLAYAPIEYLVLSVGAGYDRFNVSEYFKGNYGFSPSFGVYGFTPFLGPYFRLTAGVDVQYFSSDDDFGYRYYGSVIDPFLGVIISPSKFADIGLGFKGHIIEGHIERPTPVGLSPSDDVYFSNGQIYRAYVSLTLISPLERVFMLTAFEGSPDMTDDWGQGPPEASFSISLGLLLGWHERKKPSEKGPIYFPEMPELRKTAQEMENEDEDKDE